MADNIYAVGLEIDTAQFERAIQRAERRLDALEDEFDKTTSKANRQEATFNSLGSSVVKLAVAYGAFRVARSAADGIFDTNVEFQKLEAQLRTVTGSAEGAERAFNLITQFAVRTPFEVQNLTKALTDLQVRGANPTEERLQGLGNVAAGFAEDIGRLTDAIISAANGMSRPLRQFGIDAKTEGDRVTLTFGDITKTVAATAEGISAFVAEIGNTRFADAMSERMKTLDGSISNLKDSASLAAREIGEQGLNDEIARLVKLLDQTIQESDGAARSLGRGLAAGVGLGIDALEELIEHQEAVLFVLEALGSVAVVAGLSAAAKGVRALTLAMAQNPAGAIITLAAAIGGPLLLKMLTAKDAAEELADAIRDIKPPNLVGLSDEELRDRKAFLERQAEILKVGLGQNGQNDANRFLLAGNTRERAAIDSELAFRDDERRRPLIQANEEAAKTTKELTDKLRVQKTELTEGSAAAMRLSLALQGLNKDQIEGIVALDREVTARTVLKDARAEQLKAIDSITDALEEESLRLRLSERELLRYELAVAGADEATTEFALSLFDENRRLEVLRESRRRVAESMKEDSATRAAALQAEFNQLKNSADRMAESIVDAFTEAGDGAYVFWERVSRAVDGIIEELLRLTARKLITEPLSDALVAALGGAAGIGAPTSGALSNGTGLEAVPKGGGASNATVVHLTQNLNLAAVDSRGMDQVLRDHKGTIATLTVDAIRESEALAAQVRG